jgi:hypothetical protein
MWPRSAERGWADPLGVCSLEPSEPSTSRSLRDPHLLLSSSLLMPGEPLSHHQCTGWVGHRLLSTSKCMHDAAVTAAAVPVLKESCLLIVVHRGAEDAALARDGYDFYGTTLRVELARGGNPRGPPRGPTNRRPGTGFRVTIRGLPASASWQDLKVCSHVSLQSWPWLAVVGLAFEWLSCCCMGCTSHATASGSADGMHGCVSSMG